MFWVLLVCALLAVAWVLVLFWWSHKRRLLRQVPKTRFPLVLVHGYMGFNERKLFGIRVIYFNQIVRALRKSGLTVYVPQLPMAESIEVRAKALATFIRSIPDKKVNIIAHSMGGLDARWAIVHCGLHKRVGALVTIGTPHRGSAIADIAARASSNFAVRKLFQAIGLGKDAIEDLQTSSMESFNDKCKDHPAIRYYSVVGTSSPRRKMHPILVPGYLAFRKQDNDGLVSQASQRWGEIMLEIDADHMGQIGWSRHFDAIEMFQQIATHLREEGY